MRTFGGAGLVIGIGLLGTAAPVAAHVPQAESGIGAAIADVAQVGATVQAVGKDSLTGIAIPFPDGVKGYPDLTYETIPGYRPLKLDLFLPPDRFKTTAPRPWIMYIHGGGWVGGGPRRSAAYSDWPRVLASIAAKGYVVVSVSYRFAAEAPFPAQIKDVKAAIQWLHANAAAYHLDPARGAVWGQSAGGHLAALAGVSCGVAAFEPDAAAASGNANVEKITPEGVAGAGQTDCVKAVVSWFGVYRFPAGEPSTSATGGPMALLLDCGDAPCPADRMKAASPISYVDAKDPPTLLIHGSADTTVPEAQTEEFAAALAKAGVPVEKIVIPGVGHSWIGKTPEATRAASKRALERTLDFIDEQIGDRAAAR
jgi:acetyl esterase/lipase